MRDAFFEELHTLFRNDERVVFITGDLGYKLFAPLVETDSSRVVNFGIREGAMIGFAAGLAATGCLPFVYSIVPFLTLRCLEQIKLDLCYNRLRAVLVGVGGGFAYGPNGPTHHGVDDIGVLSALPNLQCWTPATPREVREFVRSAPGLACPAFLRLGRNGELDLALPDHGDGLPMALLDGPDGTIITYGVLLHEVLEAAKILHGEGIRPRILHVPAMSPFPGDALIASIAEDKPCMTVEEHVAAGGLGQQLALRLLREQHRSPFSALTVPDRFPKACYGRPASLAWAGLDAQSVAARFGEMVND